MQILDVVVRQFLTSFFGTWPVLRLAKLQNERS